MASWQTIEDVANVRVSPELVIIAEVRAPHHHRIGVEAVSQIDALVNFAAESGSSSAVFHAAIASASPLLRHAAE